MTVQEVLANCLSYRENYFIHNNAFPEEIELTTGEYNVLLRSESLQMYIGKPVPPIKKKTNIRTDGFFHSSSREEIEYDFHAPEYLDALSSWKIDSANFSINFPHGRIYGMKIILKDEK